MLVQDFNYINARSAVDWVENKFHNGGRLFHQTREYEWTNPEDHNKQDGNEPMCFDDIIHIESCQSVLDIKDMEFINIEINNIDKPIYFDHGSDLDRLISSGIEIKSSSYQSFLNDIKVTEHMFEMMMKKEMNFPTVVMSSILGWSFPVMPLTRQIIKLFPEVIDLTQASLFACLRTMTSGVEKCHQ